MDDYLPKPLNKTDLIAMICAHGRRAEAPVPVFGRASALPCA
jgi:hypothetical protein